MLIDHLKQAEVAVWGFGVEGQATCEYLLKRCRGLKFTVLCKASEVPKDFHTHVTFETAAQNADLLNRFDVVIKSPGITPYQQAVEQFSGQLTSGSDLWFSNERRTATVIAVTGTKGKSTACAMLSEALQALGKQVILAGNFGLPLIQCLGEYDYVVLETSSYQAQASDIKADVAVLLNLFSEHLDWHQSESQYHEDKWQLLKHAQDFVVLNRADSNTQNRLEIEPVSASIRYFQEQHGFYELNGVLMYQDKALFSGYGWQLKGQHNLINAAAVCTVLMNLGLDIKVALNALKQFKGLPHRLETVVIQNGVSYINDSIASTPHATWAALSAVNVSKTLLLVGGFDRGVDWAWWVDAIKTDPPKVIICSGGNGEKIHQLILNRQIKTQCMCYDTLQQAFQAAQKLVKPGDTLLLSPGAPSFDAYDNYIQRGNEFKQWIN